MELDGQTVRLTLKNGVQLTNLAKEVSSVQPLAGRALYLSDVEPHTSRQGDGRPGRSSSVLEEHREAPELGPFDRVLDAVRHRVDENLRAGQAIRG